MSSEKIKKNVAISILKDVEIDEVISFYNRIYNETRTREKFVWEFHNAPSGKAIYVVAKDTDTNKIVGSQCAIPIELIAQDGTVILTAKSEDTLVDPEYRGLNIFENMYQLLFEKCRENGIKYLWGFTSAKKPFLKLGFEIPYDQSQSVMAININAAYSYLSQLNPKNNFSSRFKIGTFCFISKMVSIKKSFGSQQSIDKDFSYKELGKKILKEAELPVLMSARNGFSIKLDLPFMTWRIENNPYHDKIFNVYFLSQNTMVANLIFNHHKDGVWFLVNDMYAETLTLKQKQAMLRKAVKGLLHQEKSAIKLIRTWDFKHNALGNEELVMRKKVGFSHIDRGISFVWKSLDEHDTLKTADFNLSRIATQGKI